MGADELSSVEQDRQSIVEAKEKGLGATIACYTKLSGPGWLQSAITLGGGSLAGSLYLGVLGGFALLWLQPIAMILGIIMLSAISYVTLSSGERPFQAVNKHVNPVLGWGWAIATMMANMVWSMPQFSLGTAAVRQNICGGSASAPSELLVCVILAVLCSAIVICYDSGGAAVKIFNVVIKVMVGLIVISFFGVLVKMATSGDGLEWGKIIGGFIPNPKLLVEPAATFKAYIAATDPQFQGFWRTLILDQQRAVMITAAATAVGINMTFLLPYSMLKRGWGKEFRGLAIFDLSTGLFIPFLLATSCVVIAAASQFHTKPTSAPVAVITQDGTLKANGSAVARLKKEIGADVYNALPDTEKAAKINALPEADKMLASMLVKRDANALAASLAPLTGKGVANYVFGFGVLGMAISTIIVLMLINGFVICEVLGKELKGTVYKVGSLLPMLTGVFGALWLWKGKAKFWLAVPTSNFGMVLLPVAYFTFFLMMNQKRILGKHLPTGNKRLVWNILMGVSATAAGLASLWTLWAKLKWIGIGIAAGFLALALIVHFVRGPQPIEQPVEEPEREGAEV